MTIALIDGDIVCYRAAIVQQQSFKWDSVTTTTQVTGSAHAAAQMALEMVRAWTKLAGCRRSILAFTGSDNWRKRILPSYKANRTSGKPLVYQETVMAVEERFRCERVQGLEGDDILGIMATRPKYAGGAVIVSIDKDLKTIPGRFFNPTKSAEGVLEVSEADADYWWMIQTLMGDTSDGYTGLPGCGKVKAEKVLGVARNLRSHWMQVVTAYAAKGLTERDALVQARVARILRDEDYDGAAKEVLLWHPTTRVRIPLVQIEESACITE